MYKTERLTMGNGFCSCYKMKLECSINELAFLEKVNIKWEIHDKENVTQDTVLVISAISVYVIDNFIRVKMCPRKIFHGG